MMLERSPSHSWWWNSHNSPKHSKWLQANLQELDEKVQAMLRLIEEDADSFAKRAEMYYQKRPELVNLVEQFYRAYRSLAERYDYLAGEIRQNIPKALQVQLGLSCVSPQSGGRQHHYSPLRRSDQQTFNSLLNRAEQFEGEMKENYSIAEMKTPEFTSVKHNSGLYYPKLEHFNGNDHSDFLESCIQENLSSKASSSDSEAENFTPLVKLRQEIQNLEAENRLLTDSHKKVLQLNDALEKKVEALEDQWRSTENKEGLPMDEVGLDSLLQRKQVEACSVMVGEAVQDGCCINDHNDASPYEVSDMDCNAVGHPGFGNHGGICCNNQNELMNVDRQQTLASSSQRNPSVLTEENEVLKQAICERSEEKKEAIRQLCLSIDILKHENQRLHGLLASTKGRLHPLRPGWMKFFCLEDAEVEASRNS